MVQRQGYTLQITVILITDRNHRTDHVTCYLKPVVICIKFIVTDVNGVKTKSSYLYTDNSSCVAVTSNSCIQKVWEEICHCETNRHSTGSSNKKEMKNAY